MQTQLVGWRAKAPTKTEALRELLSDGRWHSNAAMAKVAGFRYGAKLFVLHTTVDISNRLAPLHYETRAHGGDDSRMEYRITDKAHCDICKNPKRMRPVERIAQLEKENSELRARIAQLEAK